MYWRITAIGAPPQLAAQAADNVALLAYALMLAGQRMLPLGIQGVFICIFLLRDRLAGVPPRSSMMRRAATTGDA